MLSFSTSFIPFTLQQASHPSVICLARPCFSHHLTHTTFSGRPLKSHIRHFSQPQTIIPPQASFGDENKGDENPPTWQFAYFLTALATAATGGYTLAASSALFLFLGRAADAPAWLCTLSALFSSALIDATVLSTGFTSTSLTTTPSLLPYAVFIVGFVISSAFDFDDVFGTITPGAKPASLDINSANGEPSIADDSDVGLDSDSLRHRGANAALPELKSLADEDIAKWDQRTFDIPSSTEDTRKDSTDS